MNFFFFTPKADEKNHAVAVACNLFVFLPQHNFNNEANL